MSGTYRTLGGSDKFRNISVGNNKGSRAHVRTKYTWRNNKIYIREMGFDGVDLIQIRLKGIA